MVKFITIANLILVLISGAAQFTLNQSELETTIDSAPVKIGLALSGGAALGFAHIGVLKVLEEAGIPISYISGNSMGSLVGGIYAAGLKITEMESIAINANWSRLFSANPPFGAQYLPERQQSQRYIIQLRHRNFFPALPSGLIPLQNVEFLLMDLLSEIEYNTYYDFDSLPIPFRAIAVDLVTGEKRIIKKGRLSQAIRASIAIPGVFAPEELDDQQLVDGGVQQYLPVDPLLEYSPDFIIAVLTMKHNPTVQKDSPLKPGGRTRNAQREACAETSEAIRLRRSVSAKGGQIGSSEVSLIDIVSRSIDVANISDLNRQKQLADILIEPNVDPFLHSDFARARELIRAGEEAARAALPKIYAKLASRKIVGSKKKISPRPLPLVHAIRFEGIRITHPRLLYNEMKTCPGNYLDFKQLVNDLNRIFNTGLFEAVNYRLEFTGNPSKTDWDEGKPLISPGFKKKSFRGFKGAKPLCVDIIIKIKERAYGFYSLGLYYNNIDNVGLGIEVGQGNLAGSGASVRGVIHWGNPNEYRLGLTGTRLFRLPFGYRLDAFWRSLDRSYYKNGKWLTDYNTDNRGGVAEVGYSLGRDAYFNVGLNAYQATYRMPPLAVFDSIPPKEWVIGPTLFMEFNNFNDLFFPSRGLTYHWRGLIASKKLRSQNDFIKIEFATERIIPLSTQILFRYGAELGITWGRLAWTEFFHSGGKNLVGFAQNEFTTDQKAIVRLGFDIQLFRLFNRNDYPFYLQLFANIATFQKLNQLADNFQADSMLFWGTGVGIRTNTPIGPFQFVFGVADIAKSPHYPTARVNVAISVGRDFRYLKD